MLHVDSDIDEAEHSIDNDDMESEGRTSVAKRLTTVGNHLAFDKKVDDRLIWTGFHKKTFKERLDHVWIQLLLLAALKDSFYVLLLSDQCYFISTDLILCY